MYVARIPNRNSNPTWLLRKSTWKNGKSVKTTLLNLNPVPHEFRMVESPGGISPPGALRTEREPLDSLGSSYPDTL